MERDSAVDEYLRRVPPERAEAMAAIREACLEELEGFEETMAYRMPSYERDGEVEVAFASQKRHLSLYVLRTDVMEAHGEQLGGVDRGKGVIRYGSAARVDLVVVRSLLRATAASSGPIC